MSFYEKASDALRAPVHLLSFLVILFLPLFISLIPARANAAPFPSSIKTIFDLSLEDVLRIQVRATQQNDRFDVSDTLTSMSGKSLELLGRETLSASLELIPEITITHHDKETFSLQAKEANSRPLQVGVLVSDGETVRPLVTKGRFSDTQIPLEKIARIEVVRREGTSLFAPNHFDLVVVIVLRPHLIIEGGTKA